MAYTSHGHHIPGTVMNGERPLQVARCGGPPLCTDCAKETANYISAHQKEMWETLKMTNDKGNETHDEKTLLKVLNSLLDAGVKYEQAINAIRIMQNNGILFREYSHEGT